MKAEVEAAFKEMLDISNDIDKALLFAPDGVLVSNLPLESQQAVVAQANELIRLGDARAVEMGSPPLTQLVVEASSGLVFVARESDAGGLTIIATGRKGSRVGLVLYDLKTCLRDAREAIGSVEDRRAESEES